MKRLIPWVLFALFIGCAYQYEVVEEEYVEEEPQYSEAQIDSLIRYNRMFFYDYYKQENCRRALDYFWKYINYDTKRKYNDFAQAGQCYIKLASENPENADSARIVYEIGVERFPDSDYLHNALGIIYKNKGDAEKARYHYEHAAQIDPSKAEYWIPLSEIYTADMKWELAIEACEKALEADPNSADIRERRANLIRDHRSLEQYIAALIAEIELNPKDIEKRLALAKQYISQSAYQKAEEALQALLKIDDKNYEALKKLGEVRQNLSNYDKAIDAYKRILKFRPEDVDVKLEIASCYKSLKDYPSARVYVMKALDDRPGYGTAYLRLGEVYETAADQNSSGKIPSYDDKLVFTIAYGLFEKAANSGDYNAMDNAKRKMNYLESNLLLPQKSDWFMKQSVKHPAAGEYGWIKESWPEACYIQTYLKRYTG
ncbi:tetratricopeptide repeat protein [bacterium]|nr:tetratricopeptide repeat protein [bacterium]